MIKSQAPGKMILLGEYAVLEGAPALVCAVDRQARISTEAKKGNEFFVDAHSLNIPVQPFVINANGSVRFDPELDENILRRLGFFKQIVEESGRYLSGKDYSLQALSISLDTDDFYSRELNSKFGFGSSAAMTVALCGALFKTVGYPYKLAELFEFALHTHRKAQGNLGSGIDIAASSFGGVLRYQMSAENEPVRVPEIMPEWPELFMQAVWTGHSASTRKMVRGVGQLKNEQPGLYDKHMKNLMNASAAGCTAFETKDRPAFLECVNLFCNHLAQFGRDSNVPIISQVHQQITQLAGQSGAAYKPSGAGSGDIGIIFADSSDTLEKASQAVRNAGYYLLDVDISRQGLQVTGH